MGKRADKYTRTWMYMIHTRVTHFTCTAKRCKIIDYVCFSGSADNCLTQGVQKQLPVRIKYWRDCVHASVHSRARDVSVRDLKRAVIRWRAGE
jgi:hypothetical protein